VKPRAAEWTAEIISKTGAVVDKRIYPGLMHSINDDEKNVLKGWVAEMSS